MRAPKQFAAFTLIELMVTLAIVAILAAIAVPSFQTFFVSSRAQTQTANFIEALNYARSEAVRRANNVTIVPNSASNWHSGWAVQFTVSGVTTNLRVQPAFTGDATMTSTESSITFNNLGQLSGVAPGSSVTVRYCFASGYDNQERFVMINHVGHLRTGRQVCPSA
jgi:prepilin-type N-terminal cleavage/methylation domain-containing protein